MLLFLSESNFSYRWSHGYIIILPLQIVSSYHGKPKLLINISKENTFIMQQIDPIEIIQRFVNLLFKNSTCILSAILNHEN